MTTRRAKPALAYQREKWAVVGKTIKTFWTTKPTTRAKRPNFFRTSTIETQINATKINVATGYSPPVLVPAPTSTRTSAAIQSFLRAKRTRKRRKKIKRE